MDYKVLDGVLCKVEAGVWKPLTKKELTAHAQSLQEQLTVVTEVLQQMFDMYPKQQGPSGPVVHRCCRCGCTSTVVDELASHPAYGC